MTFRLQCDEPTSISIRIEPRKAASTSSIVLTSIHSEGITRPWAVQRRSWVAGYMGRGTAWSSPTKCFGRTGPSAFDAGNSKRHIFDAIDASLRRLQTDYIDLYQLHGFDSATPIDETLGALDDLVHQGKVRYIGCSNFLTYQLVRAIGRSETLGLARFDSVQPRYNLLFRQIERRDAPFCGEEGVGVIPYNPIAGGLLSGKHRHGDPPAEGGRFTLGDAADVSRPLLARPRVRHCRQPPRHCSRGRHESRDSVRPPGYWRTRRSPRPLSGRATPTSLQRASTLKVVLEDDVKSRFDELTHEYRMGDSPR